MQLHRNVFIFAIILVVQMSACADVERESHASNTALEFETHYVSHGTGEPVILLHGFSQTHDAWLQTPLYEDLVRDHKVIAVDLRGHGDSAKPHDPMDYGENLQSDLVGLLDQLSIDRAHFVGFSLGANVVGGLVVSYPDRVQTATMGSGYFTIWDEGEEDFAKLIENRVTSGERYPWEPENQDFRALAAVIRGAKYSSVTPEQISSISTPTVVVFGSIEVEHMSESQKQRLEDAPDAIRVLIVDGADHDSSKAAILSSEFSQAARQLIESNPVD